MCSTNRSVLHPAAHMFGDKPYNEKIRAVENNWVSFFSVGEGEYLCETINWIPSG